jgi:hypothetical protein
VLLTGLDYLQESQAVAQWLALSHVERVAIEDGMVQRDYVVGPPSAIAPDAIHEVNLSLAAPAYLTAIAVWQELGNFDLEWFDQAIGRWSSGAALSSALAAAVGPAVPGVGNMNQPCLMLPWPRIIPEGFVRVRLRNRAGSAQQFQVVFRVAEPQNRNGIGLSQFVLEDQAIALSAGRPEESNSTSRLSTGSGSTVSSDSDPETVDLPVSFTGLGDTVILPAGVLDSLIYGLLLYVDGNAGDTSAVSVTAGQPGGTKRTLAGPFPGVSGGQSISFPLTGRRYWTLRAGENLMVTISNLSNTPISFGGTLHYASRG